MPFPLVPVAIGSLIALAWLKKGDEQKERENAQMAGESRAPLFGQMTPERQAVYEVALNHVKEADKLEQTADVFEAQGLRAQADMLRKRARLRAFPKEQKLARRAVIKKAMQSTDKAVVVQIAKAFDAEGCRGVAEKLFIYADGLADSPAPGALRA